MANNIIYLDISEEMLFEQLNESDIDNDWEQFPERNQGCNFLFRGNVSKKIKKQTEEEWVSITERTTRTT